MVTEMITLKLEDSFLKEIDSIVKESGYQNRTEFIRSALRKKVEETKMNKAMLELSHLHGSIKKNTTDAQIEKVREKVFREIYD